MSPSSSAATTAPARRPAKKAGSPTPTAASCSTTASSRRRRRISRPARCGSGPDGVFAAGTKVGFAPTHKPIGDYVWAYATAADGRAIDGKIPQGYIDKDAVTLDPQGHVLAEMDGPGCVVNIWSADPDDAGNIRIYLDEAKDPVIEAPLTELLGGKWKTKIDGKETTPFPDPIACERSRGFNLYFPIAYAKHCKITVDKPDLYYHVDYRTLPEGDGGGDVHAWALAEKAKENAPASLQASREIGDRRSGCETAAAEAHGQAGRALESCRFDGPRATGRNGSDRLKVRPDDDAAKRCGVWS